MRQALQRRRGDDGASAVEFALVLPILVMLVFGIISFGIVFAQKLALANSTREAARASVVGVQSAQRTTCLGLASQIRSTATTISMSGANINVNVYYKADPTVTGNGTLVCSGSTGTSAGTPSMTNPTKTPCIPPAGVTDPSNAQLIVTTTYNSSLVIPLAVVAPTFTIDGTGAYRCEYSS